MASLLWWGIQLKKEKKKEVILIYNYTDSQNVIIKRVHDETWQDVELIAQVRTAEKARNNTVVAGVFHLNTI